MAVIGELVVNLRAHTASFSKDLKKATNLAFGNSREIGRSMKMIGTAAAGVAGVVAGAMLAIAERTGAYAEEISNASQKTGIAVEDLQRLKFAAEQVGPLFDALLVGLKKFSQGLSGLSDAKGFDRSMKALGLSAKAMGKDLHADLLSVAEAFQELPDGAQKAAIATQLFGKAGTDLIPVLNLGREGIKALESQADALGIVLRKDALGAATMLDDQIGVLKKSLDAIQFALAKNIIPTMLDWSFAVGANSLKLKEWELRLESAAYALGALANFTIVPTLSSIREGVALLGLARDAANEAAAAEANFEAAASAARGLSEALAKLPKGKDAPTINIPNDKKSKTTTPDFATLDDAVSKTIVDLQKQLDVLGLNSRELSLYELRLQGASEAELVLAGHIWDGIRAKERNQEEIAQADAALDEYRNTLMAAALAVETESLSVQEIRASEIEQLRELIQLGLISQDAFDFKMAAMQGEELDGRLRELGQSAREWGAAMESAFTSLILRGASLKETLRGIVLMIAEMILKTYVFKSIAEAFKDDGGFLGAIGGFFGLAGIPGRAAGGPVMAGTPYLVGERGPELFVPAASGKIAPSGMAAGLVINIDARGADGGVEHKVRRALSAWEARILARARAQSQQSALRSA